MLHILVYSIVYVYKLYFIAKKDFTKLTDILKNNIVIDKLQNIL